MNMNWPIALMLGLASWVAVLGAALAVVVIVHAVLT